MSEGAVSGSPIEYSVSGKVKYVVSKLNPTSFIELTYWVIKQGVDKACSLAMVPEACTEKDKIEPTSPSEVYKEKINELN